MRARLAALILAAGASQRMGTPKALLPWGETTLLGSALAQARQAGVDDQDIVVVLGPSTRHLAATLSGVSLALNPDPETGRSASIRIGSQALSDQVSAILVQSVDQPCSAAIVCSLFAALDAEVAVSLPTFEGRRGHPVCFAGRLLPELRRVTEEAEGLRSVVRRHAAATREVAVDDAAVTWNLNDPSAYQAARAAAGHTGL